MNEGNLSNSRKLALLLAVVAVIGLIDYAVKQHSATPAGQDRTVANDAAGNAKPQAVVFTDAKPAPAKTADIILNLKPDALLASVNGHALTAQNVLPPGASDQPISLHDCEYFLHRAIDRELILETAKSQGVELDESQKQQVENFKTMSENQGPGVVHDLNGGPAQLAFEMQDTEAFMLQTSLLERTGASPNVTEEQVRAYYQQHTADFGELPTDPDAKNAAWNKIDYDIRQQIASGVRSTYQQRLNDYMNTLKAHANIQVTPLTSFASAQ